MDLQRQGGGPGPVRAAWSPWSTSPPSPSAVTTGDVVTPLGRGPVRPRHPDPLPVRVAGERGETRGAGRGLRRPLLGHLRVPMPAPSGTGRLHLDGLPPPLRGPGHARGPRHPQLRRRAHLLLGGAVHRLGLRRPVRREGRTVRQVRRGDHPRAPRHGQLELSYRRGTVNRGLVIHLFPTPAVVADDLVSFEAIVPAHGEWTGCLEFHPVIEGKAVDPRYLCGQPVDRAAPAERLAKWRRQVPQVETDHDGLRTVIASQRRGPRGAPDLRPRLPRACGAGGRCAVVHDRVRTRLAHHVVDGAARRPGPGARGPADPGPLPGQEHRPQKRGAARSHPPRDALRRRPVAVARRREHLLRDRRRHAAVRHAAR